MSVAELFRRLKDSPSGHVYTAIKVERSDNVYLGINTAGQPCLLVGAQSRSVDPALRATGVSFRPGQEFSIAVVGGAPIRRVFHMLSCESPDRVEIDSFIVLVDAFLARYAGLEIDSECLASFFRAMVRLFAVAPARDLNAERQGLWGELFIMRRVRGFEFWAPYWHSEVTRMFDFSAHGKRVEVKTTTHAQRVHTFSHRQIYAYEGEDIVIASLLLREEDSGLSLRDLIKEGRAALCATPDCLKLEQAVRHAGMEDNSLTGPKFDATEAGRNLAWFRSTDAPHFRMPEPPGVSETHYKVDLTAAPCLGAQELDVWLDTWRPIPTLVTRIRR